MVHIPRVGRKQEGYSDEYQHFWDRKKKTTLKLVTTEVGGKSEVCVPQYKEVVR
jgi:hypothetical protein